MRREVAPPVVESAKFRVSCSPSVAIRQRPLSSKSRSEPSSGRFGVYQVRSPANGPCMHASPTNFIYFMHMNLT